MSLAPRIAVLMPVYNPGDELQITLASIKNQTLGATLFLVDDGSKRKPNYEVLLKGMNCRLIALPQNVGITRALNAGLQEILKDDYDFVARVDNGDINMSERFAKQIAFLAAHPELALVSAHVRYEYELTGLKVDWRGADNAKDCAKALRYNAPLTHAAIMFRTSFLRAMKTYPTNYPAAEDYAMEMWAHKNGYKFANVPEMLYRTIEMSESISGGSRKKQLRSRLKLQWDYAEPFNIHTWLGMAKTLALMVLPITPLRKLKRAFGS